MRAGFFVAGRAIDLAGKIQPGQVFCFQRRQQFPRIEIVILDRISRLGNMRTPETRDRAHETQLCLIRQAGGNAVGIHFVRVQALRLDKNLVRRFVCEAHYLVFHRRAVTRSDAFDDARIHR